MGVRLTAVTLVLAVVVAAGSAAGEWLRLQSPNFEVYTDAGERRGREALDRLERVRQAFRGLGAGARTSPLPVRVYLFKSASEFRQYRPSASTRGFFQGGPDSDFIVMYASGAATWRVIYHEYVHVVLNHTSVVLPRWLEEGLAEYYSTVEMRGDTLLVGREIPNHVAALRRETWLDAATFATVDHDSGLYTEDHRVGIFYAQSWALVHMLSTLPDYKPRLARFAQLLTAGRPADAALAEAFDGGMEGLLRALRGYVRAAHWPVETFEWTPPDEFAVEVEPLPEARAEMVKIDLQLSLGLWEVSARRIEKLAKVKGETAEIAAARALIALSRHDEAAARDYFEQAIARGSRSATTYFEYAMLLRESGGDPARVREYLEKTVELNPYYAEAWFLLGVTASDAGRHLEAIPYLERAVQVLPRQSYFWHALALAHYRAGDTAKAKRAAALGLEAARTNAEADMARAAIRLTEQHDPVVELGKRAEVTTPGGWSNRQGDSRVEGVIEAIDCLEKRARLRIRSGDHEITLLVRDPNQVVLKNLGSVSFEFVCGSQEKLPVLVEYVAKPDAQTSTAGDVTVLEFR